MRKSIDGQRHEATGRFDRRLDPVVAGSHLGAVDHQPVEAIRLHGLTICYRQQVALQNVSGVFLRGSLTAVVGPNGAGKSSLLNALAGHIRPTAGRIEPRPSVSRIAYLPQRAAIDCTFPMRVLDAAMLGLWHQIGIFSSATQEMYESARRALGIVGLAGFDNHLIGELSAGQLQRVLFARLMLQDSDIILLDEPFSALDEKTTDDLLAVIARWQQQEHRTVIAVLHDLEQVRSHFSDTLLVGREVIGWGKTDAVLTSQNLRRARQLTEHPNTPVVTPMTP